MRERLRAFLNQPIEGAVAQRRAMLVAVVVLLAAALLFLTVINDNGGGESQGGERAAATQQPAPNGNSDGSGSGGEAPTGPAEPVAPEPAEVVPLPSQLPANPPRVRADDRQAAERAGRAFAADYLRFQRGRLDAQQISDATDELRDRIAKAPRGRGTPAARQNRAKVVRVSSQPADERTIVVTATVSRLGARWPMRMSVTRTGGRWLVTALQSNDD